MRIDLVSCFLPEVTQQIHSLRASGVMSCQRASTLGEEIIASRKSEGRVCIVPDGIFLDMYTFYIKKAQGGYLDFKFDNHSC
jgi:hypothetical protein